MSHKDEHTHDEHHAHACPMWILVGVFVALLVLTAVTVGTATKLDLGGLNLPLAMAIAVVKGALVCLFFMHLWWDSWFNSVAIVAGLSFLALFLGLAILDTDQYKSSVAPLGSVLTTDMIKQTMIKPSHDDAAHGEGESHDVESGDAAHDKNASQESNASDVPTNEQKSEKKSDTGH